MSIKRIMTCLWVVLFVGMFSYPAGAFEIAACLKQYAQEKEIEYDLSNPDSMIVPIVYCHSTSGTGLESAANAADLINGIINNYATELYGDAIAVRANMFKEEGLGIDLDGKPVDIAKDALMKIFEARTQRDTLNKHTEPYEAISKHISKIIELEAKIANLEAAYIIKEDRDGITLFQEGK